MEPERNAFAIAAALKLLNGWRDAAHVSAATTGLTGMRALGYTSPLPQAPRPPRHQRRCMKNSAWR